MTRQMLDAVNWEALPADAWVAGYVNGRISQWPAAAWAKFKTHKPIRITVTSSVNDGDVLDIENGDATPGQAPGWVKARLASKQLVPGPSAPTLYCNRSNMTPVIDACVAHGLRWGVDFHLWVSTLDGTKTLAGNPAVAVQWRGAVAGEPWDVSEVVNDGWHPFAAAPKPAPKPPAQPAWQSQALGLAEELAALLKAHQ